MTAMIVVRIDGKPTVTCKSLEAGLRAFDQAIHWRKSGHTVQLIRSGQDITPR